MTILRITIDTANDAFGDPDEVARILRRAGEHIGTHPGEHLVLLDLNGNTVGEVTYLGESDQ